MPNQQEATWDLLSSWLDNWYWQPDLQALKLCVCAVAAHYYTDEKPLWLFLIGNSGTGKTEIAIHSLRAAPDSHLRGDFTPKCFLSNWQENGRQRGAPRKESSLLLRDGPSQVWLAKDFTTFASMPYEHRIQVAAKFREIWDGEVVSDTGVDHKSWQGKVTVVAAATPEFEDHWAAFGGLGERFLTVRWRDPQDPTKIMQKVRDQAGKESRIREMSQRFVGELLAGARRQSDMPTADQMEQLDATARMIAWLRVRVSRDSTPSRPIVRVAPPESPSRISLALSQIIRTHQDLFHHDTPGRPEFELAGRLAIDTIPLERRRVIESIPLEGQTDVTSVWKATRIPRTTIIRQLEELVEMKALEVSTSRGPWEDRKVWFTSEFHDVARAARVTLERRGDVVVMKRLPGGKARIAEV